MAEYSVEQFESIYHAYKLSVKEMSLNIVHDDDTAEEITQTVFYKLYTRVSEFRETTLKALLNHITVNECMRWLKKANRFSSLDEDLCAAKGILISEPLEVDYIRQIQRENAHSLYSSVMTELRIHNQEWYDVIFAIYYLGMDRNKVAEELGISITVLYGRVKRAKKWMQKNFKDQYDDLVDWDN